MRGNPVCIETLRSLTRQEWNAAYFLGLERVFRRDGPVTFAAQMLEGLEHLMEAGYNLEGSDLEIDRERGREREPAGEHEKCCREITEGSFDQIRRARETVPWIEARFPHVSTEWLRAILSDYDSAHNSTC